MTRKSHKSGTGTDAASQRTHLSRGVLSILLEDVQIENSRGQVVAMVRGPAPSLRPGRVSFRFGHLPTRLTKRHGRGVSAGLRHPSQSRFCGSSAASIRPFPAEVSPNPNTEFIHQPRFAPGWNFGEAQVHTVRREPHPSSVFGLPMNFPTTRRIQRIRKKSAVAPTVITSAGTHLVVQGTNRITGT